MISSTLKTLSLAAELQILKFPEKISIKDAQQIKDFRTTLFQIEALLRLVRKSSFFTSLQLVQIQLTLKKIKSLEDQLGAWDFSAETLTHWSPRFSKNSKELLIKSLRLQSQKIVQELKKPVWQGSLKKSLLSNIDFLFIVEPSESQKIILRNLKKIINRTQDKVALELLPSFEKEKFSHKSMENYFHDFRRSIRWIAITIQIFPELFSLSEQPKKISAQEKKLIKSYSKNPFANLPFKNCSIQISLISYYKLSEFIFKAGKLKDAAEIQFLSTIKGKAFSQQKTHMVKLMKEYLAMNAPRNLM